MHLGSVRVEQKEADWQRASSGTNPSDGVCTNLTDWNPFPLLLPTCTYECTQLTNFCLKIWQLHNVTSQYHLWYLNHSGAIFRLLFLFCIVSAYTLLAGAPLGHLVTFTQFFKSAKQKWNLWVAAEATLGNLQHNKSGCGQCNMN